MCQTHRSLPAPSSAPPSYSADQPRDGRQINDRPPAYGLPYAAGGVYRSEIARFLQKGDALLRAEGEAQLIKQPVAERKFRDHAADHDGGNKMGKIADRLHDALVNASFQFVNKSASKIGAGNPKTRLYRLISTVLRTDAGKTGR